ncbi:DEAD/DEAH box helicase family protein [Aquimarina sp. W85]|uniref:DEAD/DEAH box helicase family protein n=1 Tax=Aquimarina rhodophyticola TaxID=3342246 RepID=UPI00366AC50E
MKIKNSSFENYPIEFKEINPEDFSSIINPDTPQAKRTGFEVENNREKIIISPDKETGFINVVLQDKILLQHKNTVVINAAVGQGKSYAIIQTIRRYYNKMLEEKQKYLIVVASPFVSLVKQYCNDIHKDAGIPEDQIYNYDNLGRNPSIPYIGKFVQVVTVNTLLGNPGEDGFKNSEVKRKYLNELIDHCKKTDTKVIFIYDEIHDSYQNFKQEYIFNLWKWRTIIHKNFILSASYNEASKVVIKYIAELTDRRIKIIESERVRFSKRQSSLHLHYSPAYKYSNTTPEITQLIKRLIGKTKNIDILSYSKTLAKSIINPKEEIGKLLKDTYGEVKDCTSELIAGQRTENEDPKNQFDNSKCNVGTNFKTGVSIKKEKHAYIIIMPPRATKLWFRNKSGVFSGGINAVIQALARQRQKGEIHIILPKPDAFNFNSLLYAGMSTEQKIEFENVYKNLTYYKQPDKLASYFYLNRQDLILKSFYESELKENVNEEIEYIKSIDRNNIPSLQFPDYEEFVLNNGEDYLANNFPFFGEDISSYVTYASIANQFVNCVLKEVNVKPTIFFTSGKIKKSLDYYYNKYFGQDHLQFYKEFGNYAMLYHEVRNTLFNEFQLKYRVSEGDKWMNVTSYSTKTKELEIELLQFIALMYYGKNYEYYNVSTRTYDLSYNRGNYFLDSIKQVINNPSATPSNKHKFYKLLNHFREKLIASIQQYETNRVSFCYLYSKPPREFFNPEDITKFNDLEALLSHEELLSNDIFEFKRRIENKSTIKSKLNSFYNLLIEDFFISEAAKLPSGRRSPIKKVNATKSLPYSNNIINLISPQDYNHENLDKVFESKIALAGGEEKYVEQQGKTIEMLKKSIEK